MIVLDLFCGLGGWSRPWKERGHTVITLDLEPAFRPTLCMDVHALLPTLWQWAPSWRPDVILASPPCEEFSRWTMRGVNRTLRARHASGLLPQPSLDLVRATARAIEALRPRWWALENVHGSGQFITPVLGHARGKVGPFYLWGTFPPIDVALPELPPGPGVGTDKTYTRRTGERSWKRNPWRPKESFSSSSAALRAEIPRELATAVLDACEAAL